MEIHPYDLILLDGSPMCIFHLSALCVDPVLIYFLAMKNVHPTKLVRLTDLSIA
jgi:hypothetical protein